MKHKIPALLFLSLFLALGLSAQTHYPVYNPAFISPVKEADTDSFEKLVAQWNVGLNEVKQLVHASNKDFEVFTNFYQPHIDSERYVFVQKAASGAVNSSNIGGYMNAKKAELQTLYSSFVNIQSKYPNAGNQHPNLAPNNTPPSCNPACTNMDFSDGNFTGWYGYYATNTSVSSYSISGVTGGALGAVQRGAMSSPGDYQIHLTSAANNDWFLKNYHAINMPQASPWGSGYSAMIGDSVNKGGIVAILSQKFEVTPTTNSITYAYSVFLENPGHTYFEQPFFSVTLFDQNGDTIKNCGEYDVVSQAGLNGFVGEYYPARTPTADTIYWKNWTQVNVPLDKYVGQCVTIQFEVSDCEPSGHCGYAYVDASCGQLAITASAPAICGKSGSLSLFGPVGESRYLWNGPGILTNDTLQNVTVDSPGKYMLVITPVTGDLCRDTLYYTVVQDTINAAVTPTNILCSGNMGSALATEVNGYNPFTYAWTPSGGSNANATGLSAGSYSVTITDTYGCSATASATITQAPILTAVMSASSNINCGGNNTGSATVTAGGGTPLYTYLWAPGGNTTANVTGLSAGSYTVTVTDANGCTATTSVTLTQPVVLSANINLGNINNVPCNGGTGSATVTVAGGTLPYTYAWTPIGGSNATGTGLTAGSYTVTVTDNNGCSVSLSITITQPPVLVVTITANSHKVCHGSNNGNAQANPTGGTPGYSYLWSNGSTKFGTGPVSAGTYTVTVTDANGCTATASIALTEPPLLTAATAVGTNILCNGGNDGSASVVANGGTPAYTYFWSPGGNTNANATGLFAGIYTVTVTDSCGGTATATVTITQPPLLTATMAAPVNVLCNGGSNGSVMVIAGGGTPGYSYLWAPGGGTNPSVAGLTAGSYTVTVTDNNGCTATANATITQPTVLTATISATVDVACNGGVGSATVAAAGGTGPYVYSWTPAGGSNANATGLSAGSYTVTVTDNHGCTATASATITQPTILTATMGVPVNVLCNGGTGSATVNAAGGTGPYAYAWTPSGGNNATGTGLVAGSYTVTVTDNHGCTATASVTITQPTILTATMGVPVNVTCNGGVGNATVTAAGGTGPYAYLWTPLGGNNANGTGLIAGSYTVTVTDNNGCTATASVTITQPTILTATMGVPVNVSCNGGVGNATVTAAGGTGPYVYSWTPLGGNNANGTGLIAGSYTVTVTDNNGCTATASVTITQPTILTATMGVPVNVLCNGGTGSATVNAAGGTGPYAYSWTPLGGNNATGTGLIAGSYTVTVTDNNGCTATASVTITQPIMLTATMGAVSNVLCNGGFGTATVNAAGGTGPYAYSWTPSGGNNATGTGLTAGSYTVTVTDNHGCTASASATVTQPTVLTAAMGVPVNVSCNGGFGSATVTAGGGTLPYIYSWTPSGGNSATGTGLTAGSYTVTVTDNNGCSVDATVTITQPATLSTSLAPTNISCFGDNNGSIVANVIGGTPPYSYIWNNGQTTNVASSLVSGSYSVVVKDANGCNTSAATTLTQPNLLTVSESGPTSDCSGAPITLTASATGGTRPYKYFWSPAGGTGASVVVNPISRTTYTVTVTDANGCTATAANLTVQISAPLKLTVTGDTSVCPGGSVTLIASATGGDGNYNFLWTPSNLTTQVVTITPTSDTVVTIQLTDGCGSTMATQTIPITYNPFPDFTFTGDILRGCSPLCVQFRDHGSPQSIAQWKWEFGDGDSVSERNPINCFKDSGLYTITLTETSKAGCSKTLKIVDMIDVYPIPKANFIYSPNPIDIASPEVQFTDQTTGSYPIVQRFWTFGEGDSVSSLESPKHVYHDTGVYCPTLMVMDMHGCVDSVTNCLDVKPEFRLFIPNAFTPNGDGINDVFMPKGQYVKDYDMYIFDRWGMQLFHSTDINIGWNGTMPGSVGTVQEDTYVYKINATDTEGMEHSYSGRVTLLK